MSKPLKAPWASGRITSSGGSEGHRLHWQLLPTPFRHLPPGLRSLMGPWHLKPLGALESPGWPVRDVERKNILPPCPKRSCSPSPATVGKRDLPRTRASCSHWGLVCNAPAAHGGWGEEGGEKGHACYACFKSLNQSYEHFTAQLPQALC